MNSLYDIGRRLSQSDRNALNLVATNLKKLKSLPLAAEIYRKLGEEAQVVQLHVESRDWAEAFRLAENLPKILQTVHSQHAQWLAESDEFVKAHEAYIHAGQPNEAIKLLNSLTHCSISENRFLDASYYVWLRARQYLKSLPKDEPITNEAMAKFDNLHRLATIYYAYATIHNYLTEPFTSYSAPALFNTSRFVANQIGSDYGLPPNGISMLYVMKTIRKHVTFFVNKIQQFLIFFQCFSAILYTLAKQAKELNYKKLNLQVNNRIQKLRVPTALQEQVDVSD